MKQESPFSFAALARIVVVGLIVFLAWKGMSMLLVLLIAVIISMALYPIAEKLNKKMPWWLSVLIVVLVLLIPIIAIIVFVAIAFANQLPDVAGSLYQLMQSLTFIPDSLKNIDILATVQGNPEYVLSSTKVVISAVAAIVTVIVAVFYLIYDREALTGIALDLFSQKNKDTLKEMFSEIAQVVGQYIRGNLIISAICATVIFVGLTLMGVPFALPLAIFTGIVGLLPYVGPLMGMIPAAIFGLAHSPLTGLGVVILYLAYQQIENTFIVPLMYNKALKLPAGLVFLSVVIGGGLFGIMGAFLALPVAASIPVFIKYGQKMRKTLSQEKEENLVK